VSSRSVTHVTFTIERTYAAPPARVFQAFADQATKQRWFQMPDHWVGKQHTLDFQVGGRELNRGGPPEGPVHTFDARFHEIVADERIVYAYDLFLDETRISVSLASIELTATDDGAGTQMRFTEQGAFLDGHEDPARREHGTNVLLDMVGAFVERAEADPVGA
jgi:uncharacterized protein YndB with AHSA1/START domain